MRSYLTKEEILELKSWISNNIGDSITLFNTEYKFYLDYSNGNTCRKIYISIDNTKHIIDINNVYTSIYTIINNWSKVKSLALKQRNKAKTLETSVWFPLYKECRPHLLKLQEIVDSIPDKIGSSTQKLRTFVHCDTVSKLVDSNHSNELCFLVGNRWADDYISITIDFGNKTISSFFKCKDNKYHKQYAEIADIINNVHKIFWNINISEGISQ